MTARTVHLYRPVGLPEWRLIESLGHRAFPSRLDHQPIFYPVLTFGYAEAIARNWNTSDKASGNVGIVTRFDVDAAFIARYPVQFAGGHDAQELWVPAEEMDLFNRHIVGTIKVVSTYGAEACDPPVHVEASCRKDPSAIFVQRTVATYEGPLA